MRAHDLTRKKTAISANDTQVVEKGPSCMLRSSFSLKNKNLLLRNDLL